MNIIHAKQLITVAGPSRARRGPEMRDLGIITDGAMSIHDGRIVWVGPTDALPSRTDSDIDVSGKVIFPGFVDSHTHAVFSGSRIDEFEWRIQGASYMEILERGGGILSTVNSVREENNLTVQRERQFFEYGTTTIEAKSGYGLTLEHEIRMLEAMRQGNALEIIPTYLGAHALPPEYRHNRSAFVAGVVADLQTIASRRLAEFCDVFVEPGAFSCNEARTILNRARTLGMGIKIHADEFEHSGGTALAVELNAVSADHLGAATDGDIVRIARSPVIATLLPSTLFMLGGQRYAPARKLIDAGAAVALASDFNPGASPTMNMQFVATLACTQMRMTPAEAIVAGTINGAAAIRRQMQVGSLEAGKQADFAIYDVGDYREIPYFAAVNSCVATFKRGIRVYESR
jgi:imidazolonepropionase